MATNEGFDGDPGGGLGFSHLLESGSGGGGEELGFDQSSFMYSSSFPSLKPSTMLCFGNVCSNKQKSSDSSSASSSNNSSCTNSNIIINNNNNNNKSKRMKTEDERRNGSGQDFETVVPVMGFSSETVEDENHRRTSSKKAKKEKPARPVKVRKEKLGERITALQQLVSPFGKTDTASVLHEAMGYIRFLHDQVQVLSSPYLQNMPSSSAQGGGRGGGDDEKMMMMKRSSSSACCGGGDDLRSRGLCLVPVEYTVHVADSNGADLWSPAAAMGRSTRPSNNNNSSISTTATFNHH